MRVSAGNNDRIWAGDLSMVVALFLIISGILTVRFAFSDKSNKFDNVTIGKDSAIMHIAFLGALLFIVGGMLLNAKLGVYACKY